MGKRVEHFDVERRKSNRIELNHTEVKGRETVSGNVSQDMNLNL